MIYVALELGLLRLGFKLRRLALIVLGSSLFSLPPVAEQPVKLYQAQGRQVGSLLKKMGWHERKLLSKEYSNRLSSEQVLRGRRAEK